MDIMGQFTCAAGDRWDWVTRMFYQDAKYTGELISANPEYSHLTVFKGGETILIPRIEDAEYNEEEELNNTDAPWK